VTLRVLMLVMSDVAADSRVLREASALVDAGHAVHIIGKDVPAGWVPPVGVTVSSVAPRSALKRASAPAGVDGVRTATPDSPAAAPRRPARVTRSLRPLLAAGRWALLPQHRRAVQRDYRRLAGADAAGRGFDVVHAHDFPTLPLGAALAARSGCDLVYDSHEWWRGRARKGRPAPLERLLDARQETRLAGAARTVLTVSPGIAARFAAAGVPGAVVVRNTFPAAARRPEVPGPPRGLVYAGRVDAGRDLEAVLAPGATAGLGLVLVGPVDPGYVRLLAQRAGGSVTVRPSLPVDDVDEVYRSEGLALVPLTDDCDNHRLALPNKLFHAVRAGVPVVAADLPEIRRVVDATGIGTLYRPGDPRSLAAAVQAAVDRYADLRTAVEAAAPSLAWSADAQRLVEVYAALAGETAGQRSG